MSFDFVLPHTIHISEPMTPYIEPLSNEAQLNEGTNDYLHRIGSTLLQSMQLGYAVPPSTPLLPVATVNAGFVDSKAPANSLSAMDELQKQLQYDKFMNEVWIGIVLTLVIISLLFCICSCLLYHQFRKWKRNYHNTASQSASSNADTDIESTSKSKSSAFSDPVPEYSLVSGLPSYESALELLQIENIKLTTTTNNNNNNNQLQQQQQQYDEQNEIIPLLPTTTTTTTILNEKDQQPQSTTTTATTITCMNEKVKTLEKLQDNNNTIKNNSHKKC